MLLIASLTRPTNFLGTFKGVDQCWRTSPVLEDISSTPFWILEVMTDGSSAFPVPLSHRAAYVQHYSPVFFILCEKYLVSCDKRTIFCPRALPGDESSTTTKTQNHHKPSELAAPHFNSCAQRGQKKTLLPSGSCKV